MTNYVGDYLARQIAQRIHAPVASVAEMAAIAADDRSDGMVVVNLADGSAWRFVLASTAADASANLVVTPSAGAGRWLRLPGAMMLVLPITSATANAASLITMPTGALFAPRRGFYRVDVTFTGSGVIGLSSTKTGFTTQGDILGGAAGDAATGLTTAASPFTGTPGAKLDSIAEIHAALWKATDTFRFDILSGALTAGSGAACIVGDLLANPGA